MHANKLKINLKALEEDLDSLKREAVASFSKADFDHLKKLEFWGRLCTGLGYATGWIFPNPISVVLLSQGRFTRFAIIAHHVLHRGYDKVPNVPKKYKSGTFSKGKRRIIDWLDWIYPEAWEYEHNVLHHFHLSEKQDPDLLEEVAEANFSNPPFSLFKKLALLSLSFKWKYRFYSASTLKQLALLKSKTAPPGEILSRADFLKSFDPTDPFGREVWRKSLIPYASIQFILIPACFGILGPLAALNTLLNSIAAEVLTNFYAFIMIVPNHAGDDLFRFHTPSRSKGEFYLYQILGSVDYSTGSDFNDFLHGFLNYQIEHHLWPDLPLSKYKELQPKVKEVCKKHGVPYRQEAIWKRVKIMFKIFYRQSKMKVYEGTELI